MKKNKKSVSETMQDELEPILHPKQIKQEMQAWEDEGGAVHADMPAYIHPTEYDESDDLEAAKKVTEAVKAVDKIMVGIEGYPLDDLEDASVIADEYRHLEKDMDYSGAFESDVIEPGSIKEKVLKGPDWRKNTVWENKEEK